MDDPLEADARERGAAIQPVKTDAPALAPVPTTSTNGSNGAKPVAAKKKAAPRKRAAPLRAASSKPAKPPAP